MDFSLAFASPGPRSDDRASVVRVGANVVLAVADGVGGIAGGAAAAEYFVSGALEAASAPEFDVRSSEAWRSLLTSLDHELSELPHGGETTGIVLVVTPTSILGAACGDSQAWVFVSGEARSLTDDVPRKPRLGSGRARPASFFAETNGRLLVATDGLFDFAPIDEIRRVALESRGDVADALVRLVERHNRVLPDDIAVVVVR